MSKETDKERMEMEKFDNTSMDAKVWAKEFVRLYEEKNKRSDWIDEGLMIGWFANAIMAGYDEANSRHKSSVGLDELKLRFYLQKLCWEEKDIDCLITTISRKDYPQAITKLSRGEG